MGNVDAVTGRADTSRSQPDSVRTKPKPEPSSGNRGTAAQGVIDPSPRCPACRVAVQACGRSPAILAGLRANGGLSADGQGGQHDAELAVHLIAAGEVDHVAGIGGGTGQAGYPTRMPVSSKVFRMAASAPGSFISIARPGIAQLPRNPEGLQSAIADQERLVRPAGAVSSGTARPEPHGLGQPQAAARPGLAVRAGGDRCRRCRRARRAVRAFSPDGVTRCARRA